jgi:hypothetical protein
MPTASTSRWRTTARMATATAMASAAAAKCQHLCSRSKGEQSRA